MRDGLGYSDPMPRSASMRPVLRDVLWLVVVALLAASAYTLIYPWRGHTVPIGYDTPVYLWAGRYAATFGLDAPGLLARPSAFGFIAMLFSLTPTGHAAVIASLQVAVLVVAGLAAAAFSATVFGSGTITVAITSLVVTLFLTLLAEGFLSAAMFVALFSAGLAFLVRSSDETTRATPLAGALFMGAALSHPYFSLIGLPVVACIVIGVGVLRRSLPSWKRTMRQILVPLGIAVGGTLLILTYMAPASTPLDTSADAALRRLGLISSTVIGKRHQLFVHLPVFLLMALAALVVLDRLVPRPCAAATARTTVFWSACAGWVAVSGASILALAAGQPVPAHRVLGVCLPVPIILGVAANRLFRSADLEPVTRWVRTARVAAPIALLGVFGMTHALQWRSVQPTISDPEAAVMARLNESLQRSRGSGVVLIVGDVALREIVDKLNWMRALAPPEDVLMVHVFPGTPRDLYGDGPRATGDEAHDRVVADYAARVRSSLDGDVVIAAASAIEDESFFQARAVLGARSFGDGIVLLPRRPGGTAGAISPSSSTEAPLVSPWSVPVLTPLLLFALALAGVGWARWALPSGAPLERIGVSPAVGLAALSLSSVLVDAAGLRLGSGGWLAAILIAVVPGALLGRRAVQRERRHRAASGERDPVVGSST
jgi:hypothetical protein